MSALFGDILVRNESLDFGYPVLYKTEHLKRLESFIVSTQQSSTEVINFHLYSTVNTTCKIVKKRDI